MSFFIYVAFVINAKSRYFIHFAYFVIAHCRTFVLPASRFLVCVHFRSSYQRVDFIDTLGECKKSPDRKKAVIEQLIARKTL